jgi:hypothetical protein
MLSFFVESGVEIVGFRLKLGGAGVHHFEHPAYAEFLCVCGSLLIRRAAARRFEHRSSRSFSVPMKNRSGYHRHVVAQQPVLHFHQIFDLADKPGVDAGQLLHGFRRDTEAQGVFDAVNAVVADLFEALQDIVGAQPLLFVGAQSGAVVFLALTGFLQGFGETAPMAITSPTDFICRPRRWSAPWNLSKFQRGIFTIT